MRKYLSIDDASRRLHNTVCLFKGEPYRVSVELGRPDDEEVYLHPLQNGKRGKLVKYTSDDFTPHGVQMGYVNFEGVPIYTVRLPVRRNSQGLSAGNVGFVGTTANSSIIFTDAFYQCVMGKYPKLAEAITRLNDRNTFDNGIAFNRHFCLMRVDRGYPLTLHFKGAPVGTLNRDEKSFTLFDAPCNTFIQKALEEEGY